MILQIPLTGAEWGYLKCSIQGTNNQLPNIFYKLFIFNCLTLNIKLLIFKLFDIKFLFSENHVFHKQKRMAVYGVMDACPQFWILNSPGKMIDDLLSSVIKNKLLKYRTLCKSILKCIFCTKGIELTWFVLFEVLGVPQFWGTWCRPFWQVQYNNLQNTSGVME